MTNPGPFVTVCVVGSLVANVAVAVVAISHCAAVSSIVGKTVKWAPYDLGVGVVVLLSLLGAWGLRLF